MDHPAVNAFVIGIVAGLPVSFHCVLMCGPLTGAFVGRGAVVFWYHAARILAYTGIGLFLGMLGAFAGVSGAGSSDWSPILSFIVAGMLVLFAFRVEISLHLIPGVKDHLQKRMAQAATFSPAKRAVVVGLLTPLLPCGPLWLIFAASAVTGSALNGAAMMFGFGLAVFPLLALAQVLIKRIQARLGVKGMDWLQKALLIVAAAILVMRGVNTIIAGQPACCQ